MTVSDPTKSAASVSFGWKVGDLITVAAPARSGPPSASDHAGAGRRDRLRPGATLTYRAASTDQATGTTTAGPPPGLAINPATGTITGTPTGDAAGYTVTVTAADATGATGSAPIRWTIANHVTVTSPGSRKFWDRIPVLMKVKATDSDPTQKLTYSATGLPAGSRSTPRPGSSPARRPRSRPAPRA